MGINTVRAFTQVRIIPAHGQRKAQLVWSIDASTKAGLVHVAYSDSGVPGSWEVVASDVPSTLGSCEDPHLLITDRSTVGFYRLLLVNPDGEFFSDPIGIYGPLTKREYGIARGILHTEYTRMRATDGVMMWHCIPKNTGEVGDNYDPDTGQVLPIVCEQTDDDATYGQKYKGGFYPPVLTWIKPDAVVKGSLTDGAGGLYMQENVKTTARMLAFPVPEPDHMLVNPATDERYLITKEEIKAPSMLRGVFPVSFDVVLEKIPLNDPRYKFPVPEFNQVEYRKL